MLHKQPKQRALSWTRIDLSSVPKSIWNWFSADGNATIGRWGKSSSSPFVDNIISPSGICEKRCSARASSTLSTHLIG